jgi:hypothetical protein
MACLMCYIECVLYQSLCYSKGVLQYTCYTKGVLLQSYNGMLYVLYQVCAVPIFVLY